jgi:hypothetical protein
MNTIFNLLPALILTAYPFMQPPADMGQAKNDLPVSIETLRSAPATVVIDGRSLSLSAYPWRDFMPSTIPAPNGTPMMVALRVSTSDKTPFPNNLRIDRAWVLFGEQVWETSEFRHLKTPGKNSWIECSESPMCEATARGGPKWGPDVLVDVVVRLTDKEGRHHLLQVKKQTVIATH